MRKKVEFSWIIYILLIEYALSEDTCERGTCLGHLSFGEFLPSSAYTTKYQLSPYQCATECWIRRQRCKSFNYRRSALSCQLCEEDSGPGGKNLQPKAGTIHSNIDAWKNIPIGHCKEINCSWTQRCDPSRPVDESACVPTECAFAKLKLGMTIEPSNETAVGTKARRKCVSQNMERGDPITTCLENGVEWSNPDFKCVCETPPAKSGTINETAEVEIGQNYTYRCQVSLFGKGDQNPAITCLQDGNWTSTSFTCVKQNWTKDTIYPNNIHKSEVISNETGIDLFACMQRCDVKANCLSFFYDNILNRCVLSSSFRCGLPDGFIFSQALVYYTVPSASCNMGYTNVSLGGSYFCIKFHVTRQTFNAGMKTCESEKAKLLIVTTQAEITDLFKFIFYKYGKERAFVGISYDANKRVWVSWKGDELGLYWYPGQPNNINNVDCASVLTNVSDIIALWDNNCSDLLSFLCHESHL